MNSVAEFRRRLHPGKVVQVENFAHRHLSGARTVMKVQTTKMALTFPQDHVKYVPSEQITSVHSQCSWLDYPKAADASFEGDTIILSDKGTPWLRITVAA